MDKSLLASVKAVKCNGFMLYREGILTEALNKFKINDSLNYLPEDEIKYESIYLDKNNEIYLKEWTSYKVESLSDNLKFKPVDFLKKGTFGTESYGTLIFKNYIGIAIFNGKRFFVETEKICDEQLTKMIDIVNSRIANLSYDYNEPTFTRIFRNPRNKTDLDYHVYLLIINILKTSNRNLNFFKNFRIIASNPHREYIIYSTYENINSVSSLDENGFVDILSNTDKLRICSTKANKLAKKFSNASTSFLPYEVMVEDTIDVYDNPENRFVKFFVKMCLQFLEMFQIKFDNMKQNILNRDLVDENKKYINELNNILNFSYLNQVGEIQTIPINSTVLAKRDDYRKILNYYLGLRSMPTNIFKQEDLIEMIENKSLDVLYEYFCFFMIASILSDIYGLKIHNLKYKVNRTEFSKTLSKKTNSNYFLFESTDKLPKIRLNYNKNYAKPYSYSKAFDPDISLEIIDIDNKLKCIYIFDAKFRLNFISNDEAENGYRTTHKFDDLSKMHTYKDAILLARGAFILYPGENNTIYLEHDGERKSSLNDSVGAFALRPGNEIDILNIKDKILDLLISFRLEN